MSETSTVPIYRRKLTNGLILNCHNASRPMAAGRAQARLILSMEIPLDVEALRDAAEDEGDIRSFREEFKDVLLYEQEHVRTFVPEEKVNALLLDMIHEVLTSKGEYLSSPRFASGFTKLVFADWMRKRALFRAMSSNTR